MENELSILEQKYETLAFDSIKIENDYYQSVISSFAYKKISKGAMFNILPFEIQRAGFKIGRELKSLPKIIKNTHVYYFDYEDKIRLIEIYGQAENIIDREYYFYNNDCIESICFNSGTKSIRNISLSLIESGFIKKSYNYGMFGCSISTYIYQHQILVEIDVKQKEHSKEKFSTYTVFFEYKNNNIEKIFHRFPNGYEEHCYP